MRLIDSSNMRSVLLCIIALFGVSAFAAQVGFATRIVGKVLINGSPVQSNTPLKIGDQIETLDGRVTLLLGKESVVHLGPQSKMKVTQSVLDPKVNQETTTLDLSRGNVRALIKNNSVIKKDFKIRTQTATMGVRGTHFLVKNDGKTTKTSTIEGEVAVSQAATVNNGGTSSSAVKTELVRANSQVTSNANSLSESREIPTAELKKEADEVRTPQAVPKNSQEFSDQRNGRPPGGMGDPNDRGPSHRDGRPRGGRDGPERDPTADGSGNFSLTLKRK